MTVSASTNLQKRSSYSGCATIASRKVSGAFLIRISTSKPDRSPGLTRRVYATTGCDSEYRVFDGVYWMREWILRAQRSAGYREYHDRRDDRQESRHVSLLEKYVRAQH